MTTLTSPATISQLSEGSLGWNVCGEAEVWSILQAFGQSPSLVDVTQTALREGAAGNGETSASVLTAVLAAYGMGSSYSTSTPLAEAIPAALGRRHRLIVVVSSDSDGNPTAGKSIGHWIGVYGDDGGNYACLNTLGSPPGQLRAYSQGLLQSCDRQMYVEVDAVAPADVPPPAPPVPPAPHKEPTEMLTVFYATVTAGQFKGVNAGFLSENLEHFRWIQSEAELTDILALAAAQGVTVAQHTPGVPVADVAAFGDPEDAVTASMLGLPFP